MLSPERGTRDRDKPWLPPESGQEEKGVQVSLSLQFSKCSPRTSGDYQDPFRTVEVSEHTGCACHYQPTMSQMFPWFVLWPLIPFPVNESSALNNNLKRRS